MARKRTAAVASTLLVAGLVLGSGCRDATQVTLDISLAKNALCTETNGTAITVGVDPAGTEDRVAKEYVTAATSSCDPGSREIGTLVLTPSGSGRASVIIVVAYDKVTAASCKPPLFKGCIVARRQFSFADHRHLEMPISIDPDCKDVPCDAFSTCRSGKCFSSEASCSGDACIEPGDPGDGGTAVDGQVIPDTGMPIDGAMDDGSMSDGAATDGATTDGAMDDGSVSDAGLDGPPDGAPDAMPMPGSAYCLNGDLFSPTICNTGSAGCQTAGGPMCEPATHTCQPGETQYCCMNAPCPNMKLCSMAIVVGPPIMPFGANGRAPMPLMPLPMGAHPPGTCSP